MTERGIMEDSSKRAAALVATVSGMLIAGALLFEALGYSPCDMCMWQRWAHAAAAVLASLSIASASRSRGIAAALLAAAISAIATSGAIGVFHAGIEWKLWEGLTTCSARIRHGSDDVLMDIMKAPLVRCDEAAWRLMGISMAGYNAVISLGTAVLAALVATVRNHRNGKA
jgi:disulfide bond formation protein DsbB